MAMIDHPNKDDVLAENDIDIAPTEDDYMRIMKKMGFETRLPRKCNRSNVNSCEDM